MEESIIEKEIKQEDKPEIKGEITPKAKKAIIWFLVINILLSGAIYYISANHQEVIQNTSINVSNNNSILLFFSPTCSHCKLVEEFIQNNSLDSKLNITRENVWLPEAAQKYVKLANSCKIPEINRGVPMLHYNKTCYIGDVDSINILKQIGGIA